MTEEQSDSTQTPELQDEGGIRELQDKVAHLSKQQAQALHEGIRVIVARDEPDKPKSKNTVLLSVIAGIFGLLAGVAPTYFQGLSQVSVETLKFRYSAIYRAMESELPEDRARDLNLLLAAGLIQDPEGRLAKLIESPHDLPEANDIKAIYHDLYHMLSIRDRVIDCEKRGLEVDRVTGTCREPLGIDNPDGESP